MRPISGLSSCAARSRSVQCARSAARRFARIWATWMAESLAEASGRASLAGLEHLVGRGDQLLPMRVVAGEDAKQRHLHRQPAEEIEHAALLERVLERVVEEDAGGLGHRVEGSRFLRGHIDLELDAAQRRWQAFADAAREPIARDAQGARGNVASIGKSLVDELPFQ